MGREAGRVELKKQRREEMDCACVGGKVTQTFPFRPWSCLQVLSCFQKLLSDQPLRQLRVSGIRFSLQQISQSWNKRLLLARTKENNYIL